MSFPENLHYLRNINKLSQERLAELLGISRQAVAKWESGQSNPDINKLIIISDFFKVSVDDLIKNNSSSSCSIVLNKTEGIVMDKEIIGFLCRAKKKTYAGNGKEIISSRPNSHDFDYIEGDLKYIDTYLGGERFAGEEALWKDNIPFWSMNYIGKVISEDFSSAFLKEVLLHVPEELPFRGPERYMDGEYKYVCNISGDVSWFEGHEEIHKNNLKVYECIFHGGIIK